MKQLIIVVLSFLMIVSLAYAGRSEPDIQKEDTASLEIRGGRMYYADGQECLECERKDSTIEVKVETDPASGIEYSVSVILKDKTRDGLQYEIRLWRCNGPGCEHDNSSMFGGISGKAAVVCKKYITKKHKAILENRILTTDKKKLDMFDDRNEFDDAMMGIDGLRKWALGDAADKSPFIAQFLTLPIKVCNSETQNKVISEMLRGKK